VDAAFLSGRFEEALIRAEESFKRSRGDNLFPLTFSASPRETGFRPHDKHSRLRYHARVKLTVELATPVTVLVLIGGGEFSFGETREIDEYLLSRLPAEKRSVAFFPTASGSAEYAAHYGTYLRGIAPDVTVVNVPVYRGRDNRRQKNLDAIAAAGLIYLGGGVTNNLLEGLRGSPAEEALRSAAAAGAVIAAIGAAASCFGLWVRDMRGSSSALTGFGWFQGTVVDTGFDPAHDEPLRRLMSLADVTLGVGVPPKTALCIESSGETSIIGDGQIAAFRKKLS
jgi:cyanophycinase-like exopeptidase